MATHGIIIRAATFNRTHFFLPSVVYIKVEPQCVEFQSKIGSDFDPLSIRQEEVDQVFIVKSEVHCNEINNSINELVKDDPVHDYLVSKTYFSSCI